jgi:benzoate membrane transport protein
MRFSLISAAIVAALVGYGSTIALVLSAAAAVGATPEQTVSWVLALCLTKAAGSAILSTWARVPVVLAWSTPGAALIAATSGITMAEAAGAFLLAGVLVVSTAAIGPLGRLIARIPDAIAAAMLAGVLLPFCLKLPAAAEAAPALVLPMVGLFLLVRLRAPAFAVLAALGLGLLLAFLSGTHLPTQAAALPLPVLILPDWRPEVLIGLGLPLYLVTMASQNLPGFATMRAAGFEPPVQSALAVTGGLSALGAFFGGHTINMAAITAAICLGEDVHPDRAQRWKVGLAYAAVWVALGLAGPVILTVLGVLPPQLLVALVALALLAPLMGALGLAYAAPEARFGSTVTLVVTAAGVGAFGIGAAFWGLAAGLAVHALSKAIR